MNAIQTKIDECRKAIADNEIRIARLVEYADFNADLERVLAPLGMDHHIYYAVWDSRGHCILTLTGLKSFHAVGDVMEALDTINIPIEDWEDAPGTHPRERRYEQARFTIQATLASDATCHMVYTGRTKSKHKWVEVEEPEFVVVCDGDVPPNSVVISE